METLVEALVAFLIVAGGFFALVGSYGLAKLPDSMTRLHAPTKATTLGVGSILIASMSYFLFLRGDASVHELLITLFLFISAPLTANFIAKAQLLSSREEAEQLPSPAASQGGETTIGWATFDPQAEKSGHR